VTCSPPVRCVLTAKALLGESTCWDPKTQCLWWLDIHGRAVHRYDPANSRTQTFPTPQRPGCLALRESGGLVLAMGGGFHFFDPATGLFESIVQVEADLPDSRMNDGKTDRQGRFWSGSMFESEARAPRPIGSLYSLSPDLTCHKAVSGFTCFNGLAWSPDNRTIYFADSATPYVWAADFDIATGSLENRRVFIDLSSMNGICDGATVDAEGCYWLTMPFRSKVQRYDPSGRLMVTIELPVDTPTCCEFGGPTLDTLYVTTATLGRTPAELKDQPWAGCLLAIDVGVRGLPACAFAG
jgi:L-arabinonolactonase